MNNYTGWFLKKFWKQRNVLGLNEYDSSSLICRRVVWHGGGFGQLTVDEQVGKSPLGERPNILRNRGKRVPSVSSREIAA